MFVVLLQSLCAHWIALARARVKTVFSHLNSSIEFWSNSFSSTGVTQLKSTFSFHLLHHFLNFLIPLEVAFFIFSSWAFASNLSKSYNAKSEFWPLISSITSVFVQRWLATYNRGYYMPAHGYEFYLWVFNSISHYWYWVEHKKIKFVSTSRHVIFCLSYKHTNDDVFDDFPKISDHFPKIFQNCSEGQTSASEHFRTFCEDCWKWPKKIWRCFYLTSTNLSVVKGTREKCYQKGMISSQCER